MAESFTGRNACYPSVELAAVNLCDLVNPVSAQFGAVFGGVMDPVPHQTGKGSSKDDKIVTLAKARRDAGRIYVWRGLTTPGGIAAGEGRTGSWTQKN
jgi:hypothetical protein